MTEELEKQVMLQMIKEFKETPEVFYFERRREIIHTMLYLIHSKKGIEIGYDNIKIKETGDRIIFDQFYQKIYKQELCPIKTELYDLVGEIIKKENDRQIKKEVFKEESIVKSITAIPKPQPEKKTSLFKRAIAYIKYEKI